uniref:Uncharacterized protein n=1 Tax=Anguilla anguilla TaxID=7936 RepID=A0A0E9W474_ANGAN
MGCDHVDQSHSNCHFINPIPTAISSTPFQLPLHKSHSNCYLIKPIPTAI